MPEEPKGDRLWLVLCTATGVAVDVTLNKYSSQLSVWIVLGLWAIPAVLFAIWVWRVEKTRGWVKHRFLEHPVSYIVMFLIFVPFAWQATYTAVSKLRPSAVAVQKAPTQPPTATQSPPKTDLPPKPAPTGQTPVTAGTTKPPKKHVTQDSTATNVPSSNPPPTQPTYGSQTCVGSACTQGAGSTATYNQYGAKELKLSPSQGDSLASAMRTFSGMKIYVDCVAQTPDVGPFTQEILRALGKDGAGMDITFHGCAGMLLGPQNEIPYPGISMAVGPDCSNMANALSDELDKLKVLDKRMAIQVIPGFGSYCKLVVRPNR